MNRFFKKFKPHTPGIRFTRLLCRKHLLKNFKRLKKSSTGYCFGNSRNHSGLITNWNKSGGHKRCYRKVDFYRNNKNEGIVQGFEYDPNRSANIIRVFNPDLHNHSYVLGVKSLSIGSTIRNYSVPKLGNQLFLKDVPTGFVIHNLSSGYKKPGKYLRAAGTYGQILFKTAKIARIKLRSGEHRIFSVIASATLGAISNENFKFIKYGKAGRRRWCGLKPTVRGVAINPVDHPHGGGEGKTSGGRPSVTPWGKPTKNQPTRKRVNSARITFRIKKK